MRYRYLGETGLQVSVLALGAMMFGSGGNPDEDECERMIHQSLDAGINLIDTADAYGQGDSERIVGKAIKGRRDQVILATKFGQRGRARNQGGASRRWIMQAVEDSLRRLDTDYIDLYQQHIPDYNTAPDETLVALDQLVRSGKVRSIGSSNFPAEMTVEYRWASERLGGVHFATEQLPYSIFSRHVEPSTLPTCLKYGLGVLVWSPLSMGWLAGKYTRGETPADDSRAARRFAGLPWLSEDDPSVATRFDLLDRLRAVADSQGISLNHLAHAFVLAHPAVTTAIIGPRLPRHLEEAIGAADVVLSADVLDQIDEICAPGSDVSSRDTTAYNWNMRTSSRRRVE